MDRSSNQVLQSPSRTESVPLCVQPNATTSDAATNVANVANENVTNSSCSINIDHVGVIPPNVQVQPVGNDGRNVFLNQIHNFDVEEAQPSNAYENFWCCMDLILRMVLLLIIFAALFAVAYLMANAQSFRDSRALPLLDVQDVQEQQPTMQEADGGAAYDTGDWDED